MTRIELKYDNLKCMLKTLDLGTEIHITTTEAEGKQERFKAQRTKASRLLSRIFLNSDRFEFELRKGRFYSRYNTYVIYLTSREYHATFKYKVSKRRR